MTDPSQGTLCFEGAATIDHAATLRDQLLEALMLTPHLRLDLAHLTRVDITFVQLLIAAARSARARGGRLAVAAPTPPCLQSLLEEGGFTHVSNEFTEVAS